MNCFDSINAFINIFIGGMAQGFDVYKTEKAFETARIVMSRRHVAFTEIDAQILEHIFNETER